MKKRISKIAGIMAVIMLSFIAFSCEKIEDNEPNEIEEVEMSWKKVGDELINLESARKESIEQLEDMK